MNNLSLFIISLAVLMFLVFQGTSAKNIGEQQVRIKITFDDINLIADLNDSAPSKSLIRKLPLSLDLYAHQNREYYSNINLEKDNNIQNEYNIGDIAYWVPGNSLVIFYDVGYTGNLIKMGEITSGLNTLRNIKKNFKAKIEILK